MMTLTSSLLLQCVLLCLLIKVNNISCIKKSQTNVLFIVADDLRTSLGCYGNPILKTLNIDNLASNGILFEQAFIQQAFCGPSRTSFLTSRRPDTTRLYDLHHYWRTNAGNYTTLPQHFKEQGYITQSVGKVFHPGRPSNFSDDSPYSWTNKPYHPSTHKHKMDPVCPNPDGSLSMNIVCPVDLDKMPEKTLPDIQSATFAVEFLKNLSMTKEKRPFFLAVGFHKPHIPLKYPREYLDLYPLPSIPLAPHRTFPPRMPLVAWNPWTDLRQRDDVQRLNISFPFGPVPDVYQVLMRQSYYAATSYMDVQVGRVLEALGQGGFAEDTIVVFTGDHGWSLGEHQEWSKYSVFNVATNVPLIMYIPGVTHRGGASMGDVFPLLNPFKQHRYQEAKTTDTRSQKPDDVNVNVKIPETKQADTNNFDVKQTNLNFSFGSGSLVSDNEYFNKSLRYRVTNTQRSTKSLGFRTSALVELVDLFPTLAEVAGLPRLPECPLNPFKVRLCTEGLSLMPLIYSITADKNISVINRVNTKLLKNNNISSQFYSDHKASDLHNAAKTCSENYTSVSDLDESVDWKKAAFSQFPRPSVVPQENSDKPLLDDIRIMGYSMLTTHFHYVEWVGFEPKSYTIRWQDIYARELYLRATDPDEISNMAVFNKCHSLVEMLSSKLRRGWRYAKT